MQSTNDMPNLEIEDKSAQLKQDLARQIAEESITLSRAEKMEVALAVGCSIETIWRYATEVKKIPTALKMVEEMKRINAAHSATNAA